MAKKNNEEEEFEKLVREFLDFEDKDDDTPIGIIVGVKDQCLQRRIGVTLRSRNASNLDY